MQRSIHVIAGPVINFPHLFFQNLSGHVCGVLCLRREVVPGDAKTININDISDVHMRFLILIPNFHKRCAYMFTEFHEQKQEAACSERTFL